MSYQGFICCPHCESPINDDALACPYCHSYIPESVPWRQGSWWTVAFLGAAAVVLAAVDHVAGTKILAAVWTWLRAGD